MHAWRAHTFGSPEILAWEQVDDPPLADGQVRIEVAAAAINFPDVLFTAGAHQVKPTPPFTPGFEVAGVVIESREPSLPPGARVAATLPGAGGYATHVIAGPRTTYALPHGMPFEDAAALTITYQTGYLALHRRAGLRPGDTVLVHAGAGGVGSAAIQLAKAAGATVLATAGGEEKAAVCRALGADVAIDYLREDFVAIVKDRTSGRGADIVFDPVGGDVFDRSTRCVAFEGRILVIGFASGRIPAARANHLLVKNYTVIGVYWGTYSRNEPTLTRRAQDELYALYARGAIKPLLSAARPMADARAAMAAVASRATTGKVVLTTR
ncbi:NADPH:quinone oxidoreductase [Sorangium cellulosum]|uniref:NADPH:quinone oxidoreductase n=1 Tax=Sorangium cellulosum TaxID=56 RepID=A0A4V0NET5_SORCE|nr:NADPH:quinone oxidoreductase family protein [Sorangium cellulosum]AUX27292.1 NADPH:quinone oxidoreductase [Sorangium cellulosum]